MRPNSLSFVPFDPATKMSEATATDPSLGTLRIIKGAFSVVSVLAAPSPTASAAANELEAKGFRVLAVAAGPPAAMQLLGLIALSDPAREDSAALVTELKTLGVRTVMVTGDAPATAAIVAHAVGLDGALCPPGPIPDEVQPEKFAVFAGVLPEDKYKLVKAFQKAGHIVGMCGDGANDAPALRQAQMGIAVSTATDVAKSAAGVVLTDPGLAGIVAAVKEGRITFQRILTYTLNSVTKKIVQVLLLGVGLVMTGHAILTPLLMIIVMMAGDFLGMSLTTDNVRPSLLPNSWRISNLTIAGIFMGVSELVFCVGVSGDRTLSPGIGHRTIADPDVRRAGVREPSHHVRRARPRANLVIPPSQPLARLIVRRRSGHRPGPGWMRLVDGATAALGIGRRACRRHRFCLRFGSGEALRIWSLEDHIKGSACRCRNKPSGICARGFCMASAKGNSGPATVRLGRRNRFSADAAPIIRRRVIPHSEAASADAI